jgi:hypothetical protein
MAAMRRSGRIAREIPILLLGTDTLGRVFSEQTTTVVLSRHGAGILSSHRFAPEEPLTLRLLPEPESASALPAQAGREAEVRAVGQMGERQGLYVYGVEFLDSTLDFWQIEFPPPEALAPGPARMSLQCSFCGERDALRQTEIEADVFAINGSILRYCSNCGMTTPWKLAEPARAPAPVAAPRDPTAGAKAADAAISGLSAPTQSSWPSALSSSTRDLGASASSACPPASAYAAEFGNAEIAVGVETPPLAIRHSDIEAKAARKNNRRRDVRTRVSFTACIRHAASGEEIVECEDVSKGGLCFRSRKRYFQDSLIEVAAPYSPGGPPIFVAACIKHVEELPGSGLYRYGAMYQKGKRTAEADLAKPASSARYEQGS